MSLTTLDVRFNQLVYIFHNGGLSKAFNDKSFVNSNHDFSPELAKATQYCSWMQ